MLWNSKGVQLIGRSIPQHARWQARTRIRLALPRNALYARAVLRTLRTAGDRLALVAALCCGLVACGERVSQPVPVARATSADARAWPEGSALFRSDPTWAGADSAYSVELGARRVLWLFGDTFVDPAADGSRTNGPNFFIRNSIAIQTDPDDEHDASRAAIAFHWGPAREGVPSSFFHDIDGAERWLWPLSGARLPSGVLLLFRMVLEKVEGGLGFAIRGWDAVAIDDPDAAPDAWQPRVVQALTTEPAVLLGTSVLAHDGFLYAYATRNDDREHTVHLARWPLSALERVPAGALQRPEWLTPSGFSQAQAERPVPLSALATLFADGQTELSVHYDRERKRFVELQVRGLALADPSTVLAYRTAPRPEGPWSELIPLLRPPQAARPDVQHLVAYAGKAHPEQAGPGLVASYVVHSLSTPLPPDALYFPELVRVQLP
jgi:hypothetical protein